MYLDVLVVVPLGPTPLTVLNIFRNFVLVLRLLFSSLFLLTLSYKMLPKNFSSLVLQNKFNNMIKLILITISICIAPFTLKAQSGCTDPQATNYNPSATINDGSCVYPATNSTAIFKTNLDSTAETSGLVWSNGKLFTHEDSGGPASIVQIDTSTGQVLKTIIVDNYPNIDWEDIAEDSSFLYIAETGNNNGTRTDLKILKISKSAIPNGNVVHVNAQAIEFSYADQSDFTSNASTNFDAEALTVVADSLYLFSKNWGNQKTKLYVLPKQPGSYSIPPKDSFNIGCLITGATYSASQKEITLIGYTIGLPPTSMIWVLNDNKNGLVFNGNKRKVSLNFTSIWQPEGITYITNNEYFISTEAISQLSSPAKLAKLQKDWLINTSIKPTTNSTIQVYPNPSSKTIIIANGMKGMEYQLVGNEGQILLNGVLKTSHEEFSINQLAKGNYLIIIYHNHQLIKTEKIIKE